MPIKYVTHYKLCYMGTTMADNISLGKNGNTGKIDFSRIKAGVKKEELVKNDARLESVFDMVDADKDGTLNRTELDELEKLVSYLAGDDGNLDSKEVKNFGEQKLGRKDRKALLEFLNKLDGVTPEDVEKVETKLVDDKQVEVVTFKDGHTEEYYPSGQKISEVVQGNKKTKTTEMNGEVTKEVVTENEGEENEIISTTSIVDGKKQTIINNKGDKTTTTINYNGDKKSDATIVGENSTSVITYDSEGNPATEVETSGTTEKTYIYQNGQKVLQSVIENKGLEGKETTKVYDSEGGYTQTKEVGNGKITTVVDKDGNVTSNVKTETVNGQEVSLQLDKDGNIPGVIVQNGESPAAIAKKFGCSVDELMQLNADQLKGKGKNQYFDVGSEIKLPNTVGIEKFTKAQEGRKSAEEAKAEYARDAEIRRQKAEAAKQEREYYQKLGVKNFNNKGQKVKADGWGNKEFEVIGDVGYGRQLVKRDGKLYTRSHDGKILREDYLQAHKAFVSKPKNQRNNTASGIKDVTYVKDNNGKVWYFDEKTGKAIVKGNYTQIVKQESAFVANQLHKAAKNDDAWYNALGTGAGTDNELLEKGINNIYSADILAGVNAELRTKDSDYDVDVNKTQMMPVEALILDENNHKSARPLLKTLVNSGAMTVQEQARTIKREMEYELAGESGGILTQRKRALEHFEFGTSYTSTSDLNEIMQMTSNREVRLEIENQYKNDPQFAGLEPNEGSYVRARIGADGGLMHWNAQEVDQFDANWVKTGAYQEARYVKQTDENGVEVLDANGQPVYVLDEGDQAHRNGVIGRLVFDYQDKEALNKGLDAVNDNPNSFDYQYLDQRAGEEIAKDPQGKYQSRFTNQDNVQRYLAGFHSDASGNVDVGNVSASNTCLFKGLKPARVQAEEALYNAKNGDYSQTFDSMDSETYVQIAELVANGDIKGVKNMTDLYNKALNGATTQNDKTKIKANAILSGQLKENFSDEQIADFCVELMHSIDSNRGLGGSTGMSAGHTNSADYQTEQLKAILQNNPQVMDAVKARVEKENFSYTTTIQSGGGPGQQPITTTTTTNTKESYMQLLADTKTIAKEEIFYDANGNKITDPQQIKQIKKANMESLQKMRQYVAELEREFKKGIDAEGTFSDMANGLSEYSGLGTDRQDVATEYRNAKLMLQQFEAAAQGKLRDSQGNVISAQDLAQQMLDKQKALAETNSDYKQTIAYGKMGIVLAPVIVATTVATAGAGAAGWGTLAVAATGGAAAGATTYGVNALEYNTSYTGNTAEAREQNLQDSLVNGVTTAIGIGQMKYIGNMANNMGTVARTGIRLGTTVAADTTVGAAAEGITTKDLSASGFLSNMGMSLVGNVLGLRDMARRNGTSTTMQKTTLDKATVDGTKAPGGKFSEQNFNKVKKEVASELHSANSERAAQIYKEGDKLQTQSRTQGKEIEHMVQDEVGFVEVGKERIDIATADEATLAKAKKAVESWDSTSRDKAGMLDKINARQAELEAGKVSNPKAPARSTEVVDRINTNVEQSAENILSGKKGALAPHDAATLEDHLVNSLNTKEEIEQFKSQLRERVGVDDQGRMFKYEVQGKDHAADLIAKADKKLKQLADFDDVLNSIPEQGGMGDMTSIRSFMNKPTTTAEQLETLIAKMEANPAIRKYSGGKKLISDMKMQVEVLNAKKISTHVAPKKVDNKVDYSSNIDTKYRRTSDDFIPDELVRNAGNDGNPINENYIHASKDLRQHYNDAIANGTYADSYENYVKTISEGHKVAYAGFDGTHTWYDKVGEGSIDINPGKIRGEGSLISDRVEVSKWVEQTVAKKYSDKYSTNDVAQLELEGIQADARPINIGTKHHYPDGKYMSEYFEQMQRTAKEAVNLIEKGAPQNEILAKLAEHYQYAANARPFGQINNSLFMNEINTLLQKAGMKPMPHGMLDHVAQRLQPESFKKYFIDEYKRTALDVPTTTPKKVDAQTAPKETGNALPKKKVASDKAIPDTASPSNVNHAQGAKAVAEVKNFINNIKDTEIPAGLRNSWSSCKKRLSDLADNLTSKNINVSKEQLVNSARSILQDLKQISSRVTGSLKAKIDNLIAKVQTMCQKYGIEQKLKKADKLLDDVQDAKDNYELGKNIAEVIIDPTNEKAWNNISENLSGRMLQDDPISSQMQSAQNISNDIIEIYNDPTDVGNYVDGIFDMRDAGKYHYHNTHNNSHSGDVDVNYGHNSYTDDNVVITEDNRQNSNIDDCVDTDDSDWSGNLEVEDNSLTDNSIGDDFGGLC